WPLLLACLMVTDYWHNLTTMLGYVVIVFITCLFTATVALFCSVLSRKTSVSLTASYLIVVVMFLAPIAAKNFVNTFFSNSASVQTVDNAMFLSPVATAFELPLDLDREGVEPIPGRPWVFFNFLALYGATII